MNCKLVFDLFNLRAPNLDVSFWFFFNSLSIFEVFKQKSQSSYICILGESGLVSNAINNYADVITI